MTVIYILVNCISLLANTPNQTETQLYSLERAGAGVGLHVNAQKNWIYVL